jgi:hypothetical protein
MLLDDSLHARFVHPIIQRCDAARAWQGRKASAQGRLLIGYELANEHVGALRAPAETALPDELRTVTRGTCLQRRREQVMQGRRAAPVTAFGTAADDDLEPPRAHGLEGTADVYSLPSAS